MTGALDSKLRATAYRLISKFGRQVVYTRRVPNVTPVYNDSTGLFEDFTLVTETLIVSPPDAPKGEMLRNGQALTSDLMFTIAAQGLPATFADWDTDSDAGPKPNDTVAIDGVSWTVKLSPVTYSGVQKAIWEVVVGR